MTERKRGHSHKGEHLNQWNPEHMRGALEEWTDQKGIPDPKERLGMREMAGKWEIPYATFRRRILTNSHTHNSGRPTVLSAETETELGNHIIDLAGHGFPLNSDDTKSLAYNYAEANALKGFSEKKKKAGHYWLSGFLK